MRPTSDLSGGVRNLGVNPGVIAAQSQISTSKWDNGDAWDARDTIFCPVESSSWKVGFGALGGGEGEGKGR